MTLIILYEEMAGYFISCVRKLAEDYHTDIHIIHKEVNPEAPFVFDEIAGVHFYRRESYSDDALLLLARSLNPDAILCGGWTWPAFRKICKAFKPRIPVILAFDNKWKGTLKQWLGVLASPFYIRNSYNNCFIPGSLQKKFARRLGFKEKQIHTGIYSCDQGFFSSLYSDFLPDKQTRFPHRFIYAGRYLELKGVLVLWNAFSECMEEEKTDWELWCLGTGPEKPLQHKKIRHIGFVQQAQFPEWMKQTGVFILPSNSENWGVALHEFVSAGFPVICSSQVAASERFLKNTANGFIFQAGNKEDLKTCIKKIMRLSDTSLLEMGKISHELSEQITPAKWASTIQQIITTPIH
ncbi:MAG: glycosyltransferase family 4 protein [Bacteroidia bacterium]